MSPRRPPVVIVGAGLAGLIAARALTRGGREVLLLESADRPGGRVTTDLVEGFLVDRGFQVLNTGYPAVSKELELGPLRLGRFVPGALVRTADGLHLMADPRRLPRALATTLRAPVGGLRDRVRVAAVSADLVARPSAARAERHVTTLERWRERGVSDAFVAGFLRPFLSGVLLDRDLGASSRFTDLVWRSFARGAIAVPAEGMRAIPEQVAADLPPGCLQLGRLVTAVEPGTVTTADGPIDASAVIVATDPANAGALLGVPTPPMYGVTTWFHAAPRPPTSLPALVLDGVGRTPIVNSITLTNAAPSYAGDGRALVATSVLLGASDSGEAPAPLDDDALRRHLSWLYDADCSEWELVATRAVPQAIPAYPPGSPLRRPVAMRDGLFAAGDWRDTPSIQGALVSGRRAAQAVLSGSD